MDGPATPQAAIQTPKGSKFTKLILIVMGIVLLVVISEAGYYFYTQRASGPSPISTPTPTPEERPITTPGPDDRSLRYEKAIRFLGEIEPLVSRSSFFLSVNLSRVVYGEVVESVFEENTIDVVRTSYRLTLKNDETDLQLHFLLDPDQVASAEIVLKNDAGETTPIKLQDIRPGDKVLVREEFDVLSDQGDTMYFEVSRTTI